MTKINWKPGTMLSPVPPVMVSCGTVDKPNVMTVAWTGIISSDPVMTYVSIRPQRYSHDIIKESGEFVINLPTWNMVTAVDFCGVKSGKDIDKFKEMKLTPTACENVNAPQIAECPVSIACKVKSVTNYGVHDMFLAEVVGVSVDDKYIDDKGALDLEKAGILAYAHGKYYTLGRNLGSFGFSVNKAKLKDMQKMEKVIVEVKQSKTPSDDTKKSAKPYRTPFGLRPARRAKNTSEVSEPKKDSRPARDENRKPLKRGNSERRDFRGNANSKRNSAPKGERRAPKASGSRRPTGSVKRKPAPKK